MSNTNNIELQAMNNGASHLLSLNCQTNSNDDDVDADDVTIIFLETENDRNNDVVNGTSDSNNNSLPVWIDRLDSESILLDERRRAIVLSELKRIQRRSFLNFAILCALPLLFFTIMVIIVFGKSEKGTSCVSTVTYCTLEARSFGNAFTTRCICDPIPVERNGTQG
jgi:hypothetical protein